MSENFSKQFRQYLRSPLYDHEDVHLGDTVVRNHFNLSPRKKCVDAVAHRHECTYDLLEEKTDSDIEEAILKFSEVYYAMQDQGKVVKECHLFYHSLRKVKHRGITVKDGYLYSEITKDYILVGNRVRIRAQKLKRRRGGRKKKRKR